MTHWATHLDALPQATREPCILIVPLRGTDQAQRDQRRIYACQIAARCFGESGLAVVLAPDGAPQFTREGTAVPLHLSHASRDGLAAIAVAKDRIGIDLERLNPSQAESTQEPAWISLHANETARLKSMDASQRFAAFLEIWTAKEACLKLIGQGLLRDPAMLEMRGPLMQDHSASRLFRLEQHRGPDWIATLAREATRE